MRRKTGGLSEAEMDDYSDELDEVPSDSESEEEDLEEFHDRLLSAIDRYSKSSISVGNKNQNSSHNTNQRAQESIFSTTGESDAISLDALLGALDDSRSLTAVKKSLVELEQSISAPTYVEKVVSERVERSLTYVGTKKDMDKWQDTVVENRHVKTLDLAQDRRQLPSYRNFVTTFEPTTALEKEIHMVLIKSNANDASAEEREVDELKRGKLNLKEIREKQAELAKVKALMFYDQMKRHRLNKIKSKAYHRIRKRQKLKRGEEVSEHDVDMDDESTRDREEKLVTQRVQERMDLRHKNTSKWSKMAIQHAKGDKSLRAAYHESVLLGQELTKRIHDDPLEGKSHKDADDSDGDEGYDDDSAGISNRTIASKAAAAMAKVLDEGINNDDTDGTDGNEHGSSRYRKLLNMDFMKRAAIKQKEQAREEAQGVLRELRQMEAEADTEDDLDGKSSTQFYSGTKLAGASAEKIAVEKENLRLARIEMDKLLTDKSMGMALRQGGHSKKVVQFSDWSTASAPKELTANESVAQSEGGEVSSPAVSSVANPWLQSTSQSSRKDAFESKAEKKRHEDSVQVKVTTVSAAAKGQAGKKNGEKSMVLTSQPAASGATELVEQKLAKVAKQGNNKLPDRKPLLMQKSQADLVDLAFAGPDLEAEFRKLKDDAVDDELGIEDQRKKILSDVKPGWGDWAGPGEAGVSQKILNKRDKLLNKAAEESDQKRSTRKDIKMFNVMLSERRVKTAAKYKVGSVPHPFTTREEYERSIQMPLGDEWNASHVVRANTRPEILLRAGRIVEPIVLSASRKRVTTASTLSTIPTKLKRR